MNSNPKIYQKFPLRFSKKHQVNSKNLEKGGGGDKAKKKAFTQNIKRGYENPFEHPLEHPLASRICLHAAHQTRL